MQFDLNRSKFGNVTVIVEPHVHGGTKIDWTDGGRKLRRYQWRTTAFTGQHGPSFGEFYAQSAEAAHDIAKYMVERILIRKQAYEEFHAR